MTTPIEIVNAFAAGFSKGETGMSDTIRAYFTPKTVWENVGLATTTGIEEAIGLLTQFDHGMKGITIEIEMLVIVADGNLVLTERIDRMLRADGSEIWAPRVMGIFEVEGDKIIAWRDYFDTAAAQALFQ